MDNILLLPAGCMSTIYKISHPLDPCQPHIWIFPPDSAGPCQLRDIHHPLALASLNILAEWAESPNLRITLPARQTRVPEKFPLAMDVLPIQDSAVPCERVFSSGALTDTARRNKLSPELMEALQMLKFALKKSRLDFTAGKSKEDELQELEEVNLTPLDIRAFVQSLAVDTKS
jgi:hypothetical protein